ncbi:MAG: hypothetical protein R3C52_03035 [Hyphomonadaceae bacterium]
MKTPKPSIPANTVEFETTPLVKPTGFREYDARWWFGAPGDDPKTAKTPELNYLGVQALGLGLATVIREMGVEPKIVVGHDYRSYSIAIKQALMLGLLEGGMEIHDIGLALSPVAYYAQFALDIPCVAMVTASHNENGWTGVKMGANKPLTFGPVEMGKLRDVVLAGKFNPQPGGKIVHVEGMRERYIDAVCKDVSIKRPLKVVCATGNGTAGAFAPDALRRMGVEVVELECDLDYTFPNYNANPEDSEMLHAMAAAVKAHGADVALGFDGDGDRCGVVDNTGDEIFADKIGLMLARDLSKNFPNATFVVDVKSTGLYKTDPVLKENGATVDYFQDRPLLHRKRPHHPARRARRLQEVGSLLLPRTAWLWL